MRDLGMASLFDHNMACLPLMIKGDDLEAYLASIGPKIGVDFVDIVRALMTPAIKEKLARLDAFEYQDSGFDYLAWKLAAVSELKNCMLKALRA